MPGNLEDLEWRMKSRASNQLVLHANGDWLEVLVTHPYVTLNLKILQMELRVKVLRNTGDITITTD